MTNPIFSPPVCYRTWDQCFLQKQIQLETTQFRNNQFWAKVSFITFLALSIIISAVIGVVNPYLLLPTLWGIYLMYHPFMNITYHRYHQRAQRNKKRKKIYQEVLNKLTPLNKTEMNRPLIALIQYLVEKNNRLTQKREQLQKQITQKRENISQLSPAGKKRCKRKIVSLIIQDYEKNESFLRNKIMQAFLSKLIDCPTYTKSFNDTGKFVVKSFFKKTLVFYEKWNFCPEQADDLPFFHFRKNGTSISRRHVIHSEIPKLVEYF